jgi:adenosylcobyric acid synthase
VAGTAGVVAGLDLLPVVTEYAALKQVQQVEACWSLDLTAERWRTYEIHMGQTRVVEPCETLLWTIGPDGQPRPEGARSPNGRIWGTYLHGLFESPQVRSTLTQLAGIHSHDPSQLSWQDHRQRLYDRMADLLETSLTLDRLWRYLEE